LISSRAFAVGRINNSMLRRLASAFTLSIDALVPEALAKPFRSFLFALGDFAAID
jgi:hypothetical protein